MEYNKDNPLKVVTLCSGIDFQCQALDRLVAKYPPFAYELLAWTYPLKIKQATTDN